MARALARTLMLAAALTGCRPRYEFRPLPCPTPARPLPHSAIAWQSAATPGAVAGRVTAVDAGAGLFGAVVALAPAGAPPEAARRTHADTAGRFRFDGVAPGAYLLTARYISHFPAADTVRVTADSGALALAVLARDLAVLDACGYAGLLGRKPWWKWW